MRQSQLSMSTQARERLMEGVVSAIKDFQDAVDRFDTAAAAHLNVNATDLRCLTALYDRGPLLANEVASALGLTRGATTTALDRMEEAGYVKRCPIATDGRSFSIELTNHGRASIAAIWRPIRKHGRKHLEQYTDVELQLMTRFFIRSVELHEHCLPKVVSKGGRHRIPACRP